MDTKAKLAINISLSLIVFILLFHLIGFEGLISSLASVDIPLLILGLLIYLAVNAMMSFRIKVVLNGLGERASLHGILPSNLAGMLASDFTPARSGYFFTAFSLSSRFKIPLEKTMLSIFGPQLFDFLIKIASAALLIYAIVSMSGSDGILINLLVLFAGLGAIVTAGVLVFHPPALAFLSPMERLPFVKTGFGFLRSMHTHSDKILGMKWQIIGITFVTWTLKGLEWYVLSLASGIHLTDSFIYGIGLMMVFQAAVTILQFMPIPTIAGAGASEAGLGAVLVLFGVPIEQGIAFAFLTRAVMVLVDLLGIPAILGYLQSHTLMESLDEMGKAKAH